MINIFFFQFAYVYFIFKGFKCCYVSVQIIVIENNNGLGIKGYFEVLSLYVILHVHKILGCNLVAY